MNATATAPAAAPALTTVSPAAAHVLRTAQAALAREEAARDALAASLTRGQEITGAMFQNVMDAAAAAAPWRDVLRLADRMTVAAALTSVRQQATRALLEHGETTSTSALTNEERRTRREGLRGFLWSTEVAMDALENEEPPPPPPRPCPLRSPPRPGARARRHLRTPPHGRTAPPPAAHQRRDRRRPRERPGRPPRLLPHRERQHPRRGDRVPQRVGGARQLHLPLRGPEGHPHPRGPRPPPS
ncbi:hypothetical protein [Streptomyces sp. MNU103]|uniref:hypothetical protein n=1 Tax=Streptomyces sp. MNU103 TaxID=2560024 RepID=UPI001E553CAB|nr:hypothetical protein [Streptomyces sp. MNU103]